MLLAFFAGLHVDPVDALAIAGVGVANRNLLGVVLRLRHSLGQFEVPFFRLDDADLGVAIDENVICFQRLGSSAKALKAAYRDWMIARNTTALHHTPSCLLERRIDMLGACVVF